ncbi:CGNR zinc finger domain-containing protein [Blastococcus sp. Marseille-P5729]|uniref:CGNR zinc finger domain-containing protein n=1 Tax=Blastococcus sp. Marseille-P5729 TaxID=2086582 RepID=UPI000D0FB6A7|nr:CGNR zinc finger domain-containing protein [Blastococcus sp. Marseille-P5729]
MVFADDTEVMLRSAVALVNSAVEPDTLTSTESLEGFFTDLGYTGRRDGSQRELEQIRALRPRLRALLLAGRDEAAELANEILREYGREPQLVRHDDQDWHLHAWRSDQPFFERVAAETAMGMIDLIRTDELSRLAVCADEECEGIVLDLTRNRSRRFCSTQCSNRAAVGAYRARQAKTSQ